MHKKIKYTEKKHVEQVENPFCDVMNNKYEYFENRWKMSISRLY